MCEQRLPAVKHTTRIMIFSLSFTCMSMTATRSAYLVVRHFATRFQQHNNVPTAPDWRDWREEVEENPEFLATGRTAQAARDPGQQKSGGVAREKGPLRSVQPELQTFCELGIRVIRSDDGLRIVL